MDGNSFERKLALLKGEKKLEASVLKPSGIINYTSFRLIIPKESGYSHA